MRYVSSRSLGDYNNDGYLDVFGYSSGEYTLVTPNSRLMTNLGGTGFQDDSAKYLATSTTPAWVHRASTWVDITGDGYLDNYVTSWNEPWGGSPDDDMIYVARPGADPENGTITFEHTWNSNPDYNGLGVTHFDYDRDGDQDLYVSNYGLTPNQFLVNNGFNGDNGALENVNGEGGSATHSIGSSLGDFNNDGDIDVFISTFSHSYNPPSRFLRNNGASSNFSFTTTQSCHPRNRQKSPHVLRSVQDRGRSAHSLWQAALVFCLRIRCTSRRHRGCPHHGPLQTPSPASAQPQADRAS